MKEPKNEEKADQLKNEEPIKEKQEIKKRFVSINDLKHKEAKIISIFNKSKQKLLENKPSLFLRPHNYQFNSNEYKQLFQYESIFPLKVKQNFSYIYDCLNFICYEPKDEENSKNSEKYIQKIKDVFESLKEKGTILFLIDEFHIDNFFKNLVMALGNDFKTKLFINFYFIDTRAFLFLVSIQKMADVESPISIKDIKVLITDNFSKSKLLGSSLLGDMDKYLKEPLSKMRKYRSQMELDHSRIKTLHTGALYEIKLKSSPLNSDISYIVTIFDNPLPQNQNNNQCFAISISHEISQEILFTKRFSLNRMCQQLHATRLIAIESAILNPCDIKDLTVDLKEEIQFMKPEGFTGDIQIRLWEDQSTKQIIFENDKYIVSDFEDNKCIRQLFYITNSNSKILRGQIKTKLASKTNIANPQKGIKYYPIETQDKYKTKGVIQCVDDSMISGFYEQSILCTVFYMDLTNFPKNTIKIMDIGAGLGSLSFYFYKLFKGNCEIDNIEKNKEIYELGTKYFGYHNYDNEKKVTWFFEDSKNCVEKMAKYKEINSSNNKSKRLNENKYGNKLEFYDLIFNEINDLSPKDDTIPPKEFFEDTFLENIKNLLKPYGFYTINVMSKNYKSMLEVCGRLEKYFPSIFNISSEDGLSSIFFCFKDKIEINAYQEKFKINKEKIEKENTIDFSSIKMFIKPVLSKVQDIAEAKSKLEENDKKY